MAVDLSQAVGVATLFAVVTGLVFGVTQIRHTNRARRDQLNLQILQIAHDPSFALDARLLLTLPENATAKEIRDSEALSAATFRVLYHYETVGIMVFERLVDLHSFDRMAGGMVRALYKRLRPYFEEERAARGQPNFGEWFQWLAERLAEDPAPGKKEGAHVVFRNWKRA